MLTLVQQKGRDSDPLFPIVLVAFPAQVPFPFPFSVNNQKNGLIEKVMH